MSEQNIQNHQFFNRELSWIEFNRRVMLEAFKEDKPLLERLKFLAIVSSNFDEFFMVRVASLKRQYQNGNYTTCPSGMSPGVQLTEIRRRVRHIMSQQMEHLLEVILPALAPQGIVYYGPGKLTDAHGQYLQRFFQTEVFPLLTPVRFDPGEAYINFSNLRLHIAFKLRRHTDDPALALDEPEKVAVVQVPSSINRLVYLPEAKDILGFTFLEHVIVQYAASLFPGYDILEHMVFRLIRDADFAVDETREEDFVEAMERVLHNRDRSSVVRMTASPTSKSLLATLQTALKLEDSEVFQIPQPLDPSVFMEIAFARGFEHLRVDAWKPVENIAFAEEGSFWDAIKQRDIMLAMPYESFAPVVRMVQVAAEDPAVLAIKMTLYRTSGDSPMVQALEKAARNGKHVTVMVEIKARFDEQRNIAWAERLSEAGVIVVYGIVGLKVHAKALMVVRKEEQGIKRYLHLSTGNYNDRTARVYADLCLFTCRDDYAYEAGLFFNAITGYSAIPVLNKLIMAPNALKPRLLQMIEREIQKSNPDNPGCIMVKMNALVDVDMIEALYAANKAQVQISLNIRGICMLVPGVQGLSENIKVVSVIDRNLEHTRAVYFGNGGQSELYLSSADWMPRNLEGRVELMFPIEDPVIKDEIKAGLDLYFVDNCQSYDLGPDGTWTKRSPEPGQAPFAAQERMYRWASKRNSNKLQAKQKEFTVRRKPPKD